MSLDLFCSFSIFCSPEGGFPYQTSLDISLAFYHEVDLEVVEWCYFPR